MKRTKIYKSLLISTVFIPVSLMLIYCMNRAQTNFFKGNDLYDKAWELILNRIEFMAKHLPQGHFPMLADNITGKWESFKNPGWTGGFWVGMLWLAYEKTGNVKYLQCARTWNDVILGHEQEGNHDRGFVY